MDIEKKIIPTINKEMLSAPSSNERPSYEAEKTEDQSYATPDDAAVNSLSIDIAKQTHVLIGGATRSGKSVLLNTFIVDMIKWRLPLLNNSCNEERQCGLILIDPKRGVEFGRYRNLPHTLAFATDISSATDVLSKAIVLMNQRYDELAEKGLRKYSGKDIYIIIDELADISSDKTVASLIDEIARLGGAANMHLLLATQQPLISTGCLKSSTKANMTAQIALRCEEAKDSRAIIRQAGAESLPLNGYCLYRSPYNTEIQKQEVPYTSDDEIDRIVTFWLDQIQIPLRKAPTDSLPNDTSASNTKENANIFNNLKRSSTNWSGSIWSILLIVALILIGRAFLKDYYKGRIEYGGYEFVLPEYINSQREENDEMIYGIAGEPVYISFSKIDTPLASRIKFEQALPVLVYSRFGGYDNTDGIAVVTSEEIEIDGGIGWLVETTHDINGNKGAASEVMFYSEKEKSILMISGYFNKDPLDKNYSKDFRKMIQNATEK